MLNHTCFNLQMTLLCRLGSAFISYIWYFYPILLFHSNFQSWGYKYFLRFNVSKGWLEHASSSSSSSSSSCMFRLARGL